MGILGRGLAFLLGGVDGAWPVVALPLFLVDAFSVFDVGEVCLCLIISGSLQPYLPNFIKKPRAATMVA